MVIRILLMLTLAAPAWAIDTLKITESAVSKDCLNYCITGVCFWLKCSLSGCKVKSTVKVKHRNPEVVISVYPNPGENPWKETRKVYKKLVTKAQVTIMDADPTTADARPGGGAVVNEGSITTAYKFFEAQAIGHPASFGMAAEFGLDAVCPAASKPLMMYFSSELDAFSWRNPIAEIAYIKNFLPGFREIGEDAPLQSWGGVFPRNGSIIQYDPVQAAAVIAQRVANIISKKGQPHVYLDISDNHYGKTWLPGEVVENDISTHAFQMLYPKTEKACSIFGKNDAKSLVSWSKGKTDDQNRYAYALWRPYECCKQKGRLIKTVNTQEICI